MDISPYMQGASLSDHYKIIFANQIDHPKAKIIPDGPRLLRLQVLALKGATFRETEAYRKATSVVRNTSSLIDHKSSGNFGVKMPYLYFGFMDVENRNPLTHTGKLGPKISYDANCILEYMGHPLMGYIFNEKGMELAEFELRVDNRKLSISALRDDRGLTYGWT